ncbi:MAG: glycosyltransferase family 4 protein [Ignavibacteria bacterium]
MTSWGSGKLKIVYVTSESFIDHSYTIVSELKKKVDLRVYIQAKENTNEINEWCTRLNAEFVKRRRFRNPLSLYSDLKLLLALRKLEADMVWFNTLTVYQLLIAKVLIRNFLVTVHDIEIHPETKDFHSVLSLKLTLALLRSKICVVSNTQAEIFKDKYGFEPKVFKLPIIDYYKEISNGPSLSEAVHNPGSVMKFFFFGAIEPYKGIEMLIEAAEILESKNVNFELRIYGKLKYNVKELMERIKKIRWANLFNKYIVYNEIHAIYQENNVLILPYRQVTQCGPLLIAYSEKIPVICNDLKGFREYVDERKSGLFYQGSPEDLANKMEFLIDNPESIISMRKYIETNIRERFSMLSLSNEYILNLQS